MSPDQEQVRLRYDKKKNIKNISYMYIGRDTVNSSMVVGKESCIFLPGITTLRVRWRCFTKFGYSPSVPVTTYS